MHLKSDSRVGILILAENRLQRDREGDYWALDSSFAAGGWKRDLDGVAELILVARVQRVEYADAGWARVQAPKIIEISHYDGVGEFTASVGRLLWTLWQSVNGASLVVLQVPGPLGLLAAVASRLSRTPTFAYVVGDAQQVVRAGTLGTQLSGLHRLVARLVRWQVKQAIITKYVTSAMLQAKYPPAPTALTFSYSGVNLSGLSAQECVTSQNGPDSQYIIAVGSQDQNYKGHDLLIQCMPKLLADFPQTSLVLVGDGRLQSDLRNLADSLSVTDRVHFYGFVSSRQQLATIISNAEVFAMPSRAEGLPRALIEAMSLGVASIGSRVGGISELLSDDVLFESESSEALYSKLKGLLADGPARRRIGLEQKTFITKYLIDNSPSYRAELKLATRITLGLDAFEGKSVLPEDCELLGPKFRVLLVADGASKAVQIFACALVQALSRELPSVQIVLPPTATLSRKRLVGSDSFDMRKTLKRLCVVQIAEDGSGPIDLVLAPAAPARAARAINSVMANVTTLIAADDEAELPVGSRNVILMPYLDPSKWVSTTRQVLLTPAAPHTAFEMRGGIGSGRLLVPNRLVRGAQMFVRRFGSCQQ